MFELPFSRFSYLQDYLIKVKRSEIRETYLLEAFNAWLQGAGKKNQNFKQFIKHLGLEEKESEKTQQFSKEDAKAIAKRNITNARNILLLDRKTRTER